LPGSEGPVPGLHRRAPGRHRWRPLGDHHRGAPCMTSQARDKTLAEIIRNFVKAGTGALRVALPGRVEQYDATKQSVDVAPLLKNPFEDQTGALQTESLPVVPGVPVIFPGGGGFRITFPVAAGDTGLLVFSDRSLDRWLAGDGSEVDPVLLNQHHL